MKTPASSTRTRVKKQAVGAASSLQPWGTAPVRVVVPLGTAPPSAARSKLKEQVQQDHPEGKALARVRFFAHKASRRFR